MKRIVVFALVLNAALLGVIAHQLVAIPRRRFLSRAFRLPASAPASAPTPASAGFFLLGGALAAPSTPASAPARASALRRIGLGFSGRPSLRRTFLLLFGFALGSLGRSYSLLLCPGTTSRTRTPAASLLPCRRPVFRFGTSLFILLRGLAS